MVGEQQPPTHLHRANPRPPPPTSSSRSRLVSSAMRPTLSTRATCTSLRPPGRQPSRFLTAPLTVDEGGYLAVARAWGRGSHLYDDVWVDRPQGLLVLYRSLGGVPAGRV